MFIKTLIPFLILLLYAVDLIGQNTDNFIVFRLFDTHPAIQDETLKERIPAGISEYLDKDIKIVEGSIIKLLKYPSRAEKF